MTGYNFGGMQKILDFLPTESRFKPSYDRSLTVYETLSYRDNAFKNSVWYRGDPYELQQLYLKLSSRGYEPNFWGKVPDSSYDVTRLHSGLPALMVDTMAGVTWCDFRPVTFQDAQNQDLWKEIGSENSFKQKMLDLTKKAQYIGESVCKFSFDTSVSKFPIMEIYRGDQVDYEMSHGRIKEIIFKTKYFYKDLEYTLVEHYGYGYIISKLFKGSIEVPLDSIPQTSAVRHWGFAGGQVDAAGNVIRTGDYILAVPCIFYPSSKWEGRGESIFDKRTGLFAALDCDLSQWQESVEAGAPKTFIDKKFIGRDAKNGSLVTPNTFNRFFLVDQKLQESQKYGIETVQFAIPWQSYFETHASFLDSILMGWMSPSTLGIDVKKTDNSEAQREKEKVTMYTRSYLIGVLTDVVKKIIATALQAYYDFNGIGYLATEPELNFGDYANPAFEAVVDTVAKAKQSGIMSTRTAVEELYSGSKTEEWIEEEVKRIGEERGFTLLDEPSFDDGFSGEDSAEESGS